MSVRCPASFACCGAVVALASAGLPRAAAAEPPCPAAAHLPQLTIDRLENTIVPVIDDWQVLLRGVPISDAQLAAFALDDNALDLTRSEMDSRGTWVYIGMLIAAGGAILSSVGWYLYGSESRGVSTELSLLVGLGGFVVGGGGVLLVTESVQRPLEPHLAPTPVHRLTREEARRLVTIVNQQLFAEICRASEMNRSSTP